MCSPRVCSVARGYFKYLGNMVLKSLCGLMQALGHNRLACMTPGVYLREVCVFNLFNATVAHLIIFNARDMVTFLVSLPSSRPSHQRVTKKR
jgi:hypothetical protein